MAAPHTNLEEVIDAPAGVIEALILQYRVEQFLYHEAHLLDSWLWDEWLDLFDQDVRYWMPLRKNLLRRERGSDVAQSRVEMALFDDDLTQLRLRVEQMRSGRHWSEDPPSRCRHLITNVRLSPRGEELAEIDVKSNFVLYRNRLETEVDIWAGERRDILRLVPGGFKIAGRTIVLDQNVILSKNLSVFF